jgi:hypothetical protein
MAERNARVTFWSCDFTSSDFLARPAVSIPAASRFSLPQAVPLLLVFVNSSHLIVCNEENIFIDYGSTIGE